MPPIVARYSELNQAFCLSPQDIEKVGDIFAEIGNSFTCRIYCSDGLFREYDTIKELLEYENPPTKEIRALHIAVHSFEQKARASVDFRNRRNDSIEINLDGPENIISKINNDLNDFLPRTRRWYGVVATTDYNTIMFQVFVFMAIALLVAVVGGFLPFKGSNPEVNISSEVKFRGLLFGLSVPASLFTIGYVLNRIRDWLFPIAEFAIGQGASRESHRERLRTSLVGIVLVPSILSGLAYLGWLLYSKITG